MYGVHNGLLTASALLLLLATYCGVCADTAEQDLVPPGLQPDTGVAAEGVAQLTDADLDTLAAYLGLLLLREDGEGPLVYVEDDDDNDPPPPPPQSYDVPLPWKRSRYYRRYPWKRQNGRGRTYRADDNRYMCNPSREDVFQLLVALHEARAGNTGRTVNFCNRKRPASAIFTNIRFLGRRRK
uniref:RFLamide n=1 Tax=Carausius morosus TaxID=7022 RepID=A0A6G4ZWV4_CARMO|nr:RFLamide [Carausius morosus]